MKLPSQKRNHKKVLFFTGALLIMIAGSALVWQLRQAPTVATNSQTTAPTNTVDYGPPSAEQKAEQEQQKTDFLNSTTGDGSTPTNPPSSTLSVTISRAGQSASGQPVNVRTFISGAAAGSCEATFSRAGTSFVKTFSITAEASSVTCNGDVEAAAFTPGEWQLSVVAKNQGAVSQPAIMAFSVTP